MSDSRGPSAGVELSIVIPSFNEGRTITDVLDEHRAVASSLAVPYEIVVIDDGSTDGTSGSLRELAARDPAIRFERHAARRGVARTLEHLYELSTGRWVYFAPADGQVPADALRLLWESRDGCVCIVGRRHPRADALARRLMASLYSLSVRSLFSLDISDLDSVKLFDGALLRTTRLKSRGNFAEAERLIRFRRHGFGLREVVIPHRPRRAGRASAINLALIVRTYLDLARFFFIGQRSLPERRHAKTPGPMAPV